MPSIVLFSHACAVAPSTPTSVITVSNFRLTMAKCAARSSVGQLYNGHRYPLDGSYSRRDRMLFRRKVVHSFSFAKLGQLATVPFVPL